MGNEPAPRSSYSKPWYSYQEQISLLQSRGLDIPDVASATEFLRHVNYYRFSGFCLAFESSRHRFFPGVTFELIQLAYEFDRTLRDIVTEALEVVEVDFRTRVSYHFSRTYGAFAHTNSANFFHRFNHTVWLKRLHEEAKRSSERFVTHFKATYREFPNLPVWVATEIMSFGALSRMCAGMHKRDQKMLCHHYGLQPLDWLAWLHHLTYVRNLCAHHARLWDRIWAIKPRLPHAQIWHSPHLPGNNRLFATLLILNVVMKRCPSVSAYADQWRSRVEDLMADPPAVANAAQLMGLTTHWNTHPLWQ